MASSLNSFFNARSFVIVGASQRPKTPGYFLAERFSQCFKNQDQLYYVNPRGGNLFGRECYTSVSALPDGIDCAAVIVPAAAVTRATRDCFVKGIRAAIILTSGFAELGTSDGIQKQQELKALLVEFPGARIIGPNCIGVMDPLAGIDTLFKPVTELARPAPGPISVVSQSGAMAGLLCKLFRRSGYNEWLGHMVSIGNAADVNECDCLEAYAQCDRTRIIVVYLEGLKDAPRFLRLVRATAPHKPVIVFKAGRTQLASEASASHTGSLAVNHRVFRDLLAHEGAILLEEWADLPNLCLALLSYTECFAPSRPVPSHALRAALVVESGALGVIGCDFLADRAEGSDADLAQRGSSLRLAAFTENTRDRLGELLPPYASLANPVDVTAGTTPSQYLAVCRALAEAPEVDVVIAPHVAPFSPEDEAAFVREFIELAAPGEGRNVPVPPVTPLFPVFFLDRLDAEEEASMCRMRRAGIPAFEHERDAFRVLSHLQRFREFRATHQQALQRLEATSVPALQPAWVDGVRKIVQQAREAGRTTLLESEAVALFEHLGVPVPVWAFLPVQGPADLQASTDALHSHYKDLTRRGGAERFVLKAVSPELLHKSEHGAVALNLRSWDDILQAAERFVGRFAEQALVGLLLQEMVPNGTEMMVGASTDGTFGPLVCCGIGGTRVELFRDAAFASCLDEHSVDPARMLDRLQHQRILEGFRGDPPVDRATLGALMEQVAALMRVLPEDILEVDLNPVIFPPGGRGFAVDRRVVLHPSMTARG